MCAQHVARVWPPAWCNRVDKRAVPQRSCNRLHLNVACFDLNVPQQNNELIYNYESYPDYLPVWSPVTDRYQSAFSGYTLLENTENIDYVKSEILSLQNRPRSIYQYSNMDPGAFGSKLNFFLVSFVSQFPRDLDTKKTSPTIQVCPESRGALLVY